MAQALRDSDKRDLPTQVEPRKALAPSQREAKGLRAWGLDSTPMPRVAETVPARSEAKPLGVVCEPVN